ncbi:hypothetical protein [Paenibacillus sp.]|uniref:hypothetical protein n=1 Tax=Paenibacillus sp. TaxID=58172 RepID=UPI002D67DF78|nr:hypothetical protein [Paenibacillus sp.]HZG86812.1 hypothetical protein [Paenibacillus sp.]
MQTYEKQPTIALLLAVIPGVGHLYWGQYIKTVLYGGAALTPPALFAAVTLFEGRIIPELFFLALAGVIVVWCVNMADMALTLSRGAAATAAAPADAAQRDRALATALSLIPGAGHAYAGAPRRGQLYFAAALAALAAPLAAAIMFGEPALLLLWLALPALMLAAAADAAESLRRKEFGALAADETAAEMWLAPAANGGRPAVAQLLSVVPGAGHVYRGETGKGLQLLGAALLLLYAKTELNLSIAAFVFPALWAFALADLRQRAFGAARESADVDAPLLTPGAQRWAGAAFIAVGAYMAIDRIALDALAALLPNVHWHYEFRRWSEAIFASIALLAAGVALLSRGGPRR